MGYSKKNRTDNMQSEPLLMFRILLNKVLTIIVMSDNQFQGHWQGGFDAAALL